jgi:hypothetical protein
VKKREYGWVREREKEIEIEREMMRVCEKGKGDKPEKKEDKEK